jgi:hypothetical protein
MLSKPCNNFVILLSHLICPRLSRWISRLAEKVKGAPYTIGRYNEIRGGKASNSVLHITKL